MSTRLYHWLEWFKRKQFVLRRGLDYRCPQTTMVQQIRNAAVKYGVKVSIKDVNDGFIVNVSPFDGEEKCLLSSE